MKIKEYSVFTYPPCIPPLCHMSPVAPLSLFATFFYTCFAEGELLIKKVPEILKLLDRVWKLSDEKS